MLRPTANLNAKAFADLGVEVPRAPLDLSGALNDCGIRYPYIIVTTGRTGSTWLAAALEQFPAINPPNEYFSQEAIRHYGDFSAPQSFDTHFRTVLTRYGRAGTFGFKINPRRLAWLAEMIDMSRTFPPQSCAWIEMTRINLVKQAFSYARAKISGHWHDFAGRERRPSHVRAVTDREAWQHILEILEEEQIFARFKQDYGISPLHIQYEEIFDSRDHLLIRVTRRIRPDFDVRPLLPSLKERVSKLESDGQEEEQAFMFRYADLLNHIMSNRDSVALSWITAELGRHGLAL